MAALGALSQAWVSAEASLPLGWQIRGLWRFDDLWIALSEGPTFEDCLSGSGLYADRALRRMADRLRERRTDNRLMGRWFRMDRATLTVLAVVAVLLTGCQVVLPSPPVNSAPLLLGQLTGQ